MQRLGARFVASLRRRRPETRGTYERALREFFRWLNGEKRFGFTVGDFERYKHYLTAEKGLLPVSVSTYLTSVRRFCDYLVRRGVLRTNNARLVEGNKRPRVHSRDFLTSDAVKALLMSLEPSGERGFRDIAIVRLMLSCGLSEIELIRANVGDLKESRGRWTLAVQGKGRTRKDAVVALSRDVQRAMREYFAVRGTRAPGDPLFTSAGNRTRGERMTTRGVRDRVNHYLERAGLRNEENGKISPYSLRHTAAMTMAEHGASADEIRLRMRLGTIATAKLYLNHMAVHKTSRNQE